MNSEKIHKMREKLLLCSVCMNEFDDPRILPCHHTFCLDCIISITQSPQGATFNCPQCRERVCIPRGGVRKLPVNFYLVSLQDELPTTDDDDGSCDICNKQNVVSQFHCDDCDFNICRFCISSHWLESHDTGAPSITPIQSSSTHSLSTTTHFCKEHGDEIVQLYCHTCCKDICITCSCTDHHSHKLVPLSKHLKESKLNFHKELEKINLEWQHAVESMVFIKNAKEDVNHVSNKALHNLNNAAQNAFDAITNRKLEIEKDIKTLRDSQLENIAGTEQRLQAYMNMLKKGQDFLLDIQENEICLEAIDSLNKFLLKVESERKSFTSSRISTRHVHFTPSNNFKLLHLNFVGVSKLFALGQLGSMNSVQQHFSIDKKTLAITKPSCVARYFSICYCLRKMSFIVILFLFLIHLFFKKPLGSPYDSYPLFNFFTPE